MIDFRAMACVCAFGLCGCSAMNPDRGGTLDDSFLIPTAACEGAREELRRLRDLPGAAALAKRAAVADLSPAEAQAVAAARASRERALAFIAAAADDDPGTKGRETLVSTSTVAISADAVYSEVRAAQKAAQRGGFAELRKGLGSAPNRAHFELYPEYFEDYFRRGHFFSVALSTDAAKATLRRQVLDGLNLREGDLTADQRKLVDSAVDSLLSQVCKDAKCVLLDETGEGAFVNRAGQKFGFPTVSVSIVPGSGKGYEVTKLDEVQVVGDLTRIFWEATFDTIMWEARLKPIADLHATGCTAPPAAKPFDCLEKDPTKERQAALAKLNQVADRTEGVTGSFAAKLVRGGWVASLNNEAIAKFLETTASVALRKLAELVVTANTKHCPAAPPQGTMREISLRISP